MLYNNLYNQGLTEVECWKKFSVRDTKGFAGNPEKSQSPGFVFQQDPRCERKEFRR